jgi:CHAT domain-containing protein
VAALYPQARVLTGATATPAALFDGLASDEVVHFAGHGVANEAYPGRSALLLAPGPEGTGIVSPAQLAGIGRARARLVVLSACSTAAGRVARGEGPLSLARPFLAAGVPTVVAALWPTADRVNELLLTRFHQHVVEGDDARRALRRAQQWLRETDGGAFSDPRHWAAFVCLGGGPRRA